MTEIPQRHSLVAQTAEILRKDLREGTWREFLPGEIPLSQQLQVGRPTLRAALALLQREGWIDASQGRRRRILKRPDSRPATPGPKTVAILSPVQPHVLSPFRLFLINELQGPLHATGCRLEVVTHPIVTTRSAASHLQKLADQVRAACWILLGPHSHVQRWFVERNIPCVGVGAMPDAVLVPYLRVDYQAATRHAVGLLLSRGHKRLALTLSRACPKGDAVIIEEFVHGFARAQRDAGCGPLVLYHNGTVDGLRSVLKVQFASNARPDALLVSSPRDAITVMSSLMTAGIGIPRDVSLIALGHEPTLDCMVPSIAHYGVDWPVFARKLSRMVLELVRTGALPLRETLVVPEFHDGVSLGRRS